jgi:alcohol dehydrogenase class IV/choline kinase
MGSLTKDKPKAFIKLSTQELLLYRQLRLLRLNGINEVVISTGPFHDFFSNETQSIQGMKITLINNDKFSSTNSIYSLYKASTLLQNDDFIVLHGDLVFDGMILKKLIDHPSNDVALVNRKISLPEKDFKGRIKGGSLKEISVSIFDKDCYSLQPMYKFSRQTMKVWLEEVEKFIKLNKVNLYAEIALNNILGSLSVSTLDFETHLLGEIDNEFDLNDINNRLSCYEYPLQDLIESNAIFDKLEKYLKKINAKKVFFVASKVILKSDAFSYLLRKFNGYAYSQYSPNPTESDAIKATHLFKEQHFDSIVAIGGGSAIDLAKSIKLLIQHEPFDLSYSYGFSALPLIAIPTTAGTGSESTRFAVIYQKGIKRSLTHDCLIPDFVILSENFLNSVPDYIKRSSLLDALCQAIESIWSLDASKQSIDYAINSIELILPNYIDYLKGNTEKNLIIMKGANLAGKAINISKTTGPHALSYNLTNKYKLAHGHAVSLLLAVILDFSLQKYELDSSISTIKDFESRIQVLKTLFNCNTNKELIIKIKTTISNILDETIKIPEIDLALLVENINVERLQNHPIKITKEDVRQIYSKFL